MQNLYIMRHGPAAAESSEGDVGRPLTAAGRQAVRRMAALLARQALPPTTILASPLRRCVETAELVVAALPGSPAVCLDQALRPGAEAEAVVLLLDAQPLGVQPSTRMLIGHMPDVANWLYLWAPARPVDFAPGTLAHLTFAAAMGPGTGSLAGLWHVRDPLNA